MKKRVKFMVTAFRDGFQSVYGARVFSRDYMPAVEAARAAGINYFEAGGGALFQSLYFYCNEDSFDMMDTFREKAGPEADLQTLARGVNVVGLDSQSSDVIDLHARLFKKHGISTIRNFDALNDVNNLIYSGECIVKAGLRHEICITLMELPPGCTGAHTAEFYMATLDKILEAGIVFHSLCFKDASGTSVPSKVYDTVKAARQKVGEGVNITFHTHETAGNSILCYKAALDAGADQIDLSLEPVSGGTCQPDVLTMWHALRGTDYDLGIDPNKVREAEEVLKECMADYFLPPEAKKVDPLIAWFPLPGGALTANTQMMRDNNILDRYEEVMAAMGDAVAKGGFGTSVTPVSQFYFQQAFNNVMFGPWQRFAEGYGKMVLGYFGKTPVPPDPEIVKLAREKMNLEPTDKTALEINDADPKKGLAAARAMLEKEKLPISDENLFIAAACREKGIAFLKGQAVVGVRKKSTEAKEGEPKGQPSSGPGPARESGGGLFPGGTGLAAQGRYDLLSRVEGQVMAVLAQPGAAVDSGTPLYTLKTAAGEIQVASPLAGRLESLTLAPGTPLSAGAKAGVLSGGSPVSPVPPQAAPPVQPASPPPAQPASSAGEAVKANLSGTVIRHTAAVGQSVKAGDILLVIESMKMEIEIPATASGVLQSLPAAPGTQVFTGDILALIG
ncbi:MAG: biotin attachment protein [Spirochaetales bacterium]|jgi:pyruvate carboxylase subunit B|nr:biotin attachment protein [Spirochaetales bacterium]